MMTILDGIYSQFSEKDVTFANIDLKQLDVDLKGEKRELSNVQALDAWFATEASQDTKREENKPPSVDSLSFSNKLPSPGESISSTIKGSDPENFDLAWEWTWKGKGVEQGTGTGKTQLGNLATSKNAKAGDKYGVELKLTDALGATSPTNKKSTELNQHLHRSPASTVQEVCKTGVDLLSLLEQLIQMATTKAALVFGSSNAAQKFR